MSGRRALFVALGCMAAALGGCASNSGGIAPGAVCRVIGLKAPFYKYGPAQSFGADEVLQPGTEVTMIERGFGFSRVMLANGVTGYMSSDDIAPLPPKPQAPPERSTSSGGSKRKSERTYSGPTRRSNVEPTPSDPLFDINDVPLPMTDPVKPAFRATAPGARPAAPKGEKSEKSE